MTKPVRPEDVYAASSSSHPTVPLTKPSVVVSSAAAAKSKPHNIFANDGSFLERFHHLKKEEDEKKKQKDILDRKKNFSERFKRRGKRSSGDSPNLDPTVDNKPPSKKMKIDKDNQQPLSTSSSTFNIADRAPVIKQRPASTDEYQKELKTLNASLKDTGTGVRPLVK